jgi:hypothetical protein
MFVRLSLTGNFDMLGLTFSLGFKLKMFVRLSLTSNFDMLGLTFSLGFKL